MGIKIGVLGVGPVGEHIVRVLGERKFPTVCFMSLNPS